MTTSLAVAQSSVALWVSIITMIGVVAGGFLGLMGVRKTAATTSEGTLRSDLLRERDSFREERQELLDRIEALEDKQEIDRRTIRQQATLIGQQEERILNQNRTIDDMATRIGRLERLLRRNKIPVPNGDDTDPGTLATRP